MKLYAAALTVVSAVAMLTAPPAGALFRDYTWQSTLEDVKKDARLSKCTGPVQNGSVWTMECATLVDGTYPAGVLFYFGKDPVSSEMDKSATVYVLEGIVLKIAAPTVEAVPTLLSDLKDRLVKKYGDPKTASVEAPPVAWLWALTDGTEITLLSAGGVSVWISYLSPAVQTRTKDSL